MNNLKIRCVLVSILVNKPFALANSNANFENNNISRPKFCVPCLIFFCAADLSKGLLGQVEKRGRGWGTKM